MLTLFHAIQRWLCGRRGHAAIEALQPTESQPYETFEAPGEFTQWLSGGTLLGIPREKTRRVKFCLTCRRVVGIVMLLVVVSTGYCADMPQTHFGFYQTPGRFAYPERLPDFWRAQAEDGFTTATASTSGAEVFMPPASALDWFTQGLDGIHIFGGGAQHYIPRPLVGTGEGGLENMQGFAREIDAMLEAGIIRPEVPILCYSVDPDPLHQCAYFATRPWPELLVGVVDEPQPATNPAQADEVIRQVQAAHAQGFRACTSINAGNLLAPFDSKLTGKQERLIDWLDVAIVLASTWTDTVAAQAKWAGCDLWAYECIDHGRSHTRYTRYLAGLWAWRNKPGCLLRWAYTHDAETKVLPDGTVQWAKDDSYSFAIPTPTGPPLETEHYTAYLRGMEDYRLLTELERNATLPETKQWLWRLRASLPPYAARPYFAPGGDLDPHTAKLPRDDFDAIRADARRLLAQERAGA